MLVERLLQSQGFGSRRECRQLIEAGVVRINGRHPSVRDEFDTEAPLELTVNETTWPYRAQLYIALNKPQGFECSHQPTHHASVFSLLPRHFVLRGIQCVGRLDADTTGLLLLSDDGAWLHALTSPKRKVTKHYRVQTADRITERQVALLSEGVVLEGDEAPTCAAVERVDDFTVNLMIAEGRYHQVKRMLGAVGHRVEKLHRFRIGDYELPQTLGESQWLEVSRSATS